jgi:ribosomal protein S26
MSRSHRTARDAGTRFETSIAGCFAEQLDDDRIERRAKTGNKDRGDVGGIRAIRGGRVVIECKNVSRTDLGGWVKEAEVERGNDDAIAGLVVHKRRGTADPLDQYVTCTMRDLVALLTGERP